MSIPQKIVIDTGIDIGYSLGECVKELIEISYQIYNLILRQLFHEPITKDNPVTIVCAGQSPAYYCLAMLHFPIFVSELANIIILPHSNGSQKRNPEKIKQYADRLRDNNIQLRKNVVIIDGVHSGNGILSLESSLLLHNRYLNIKKIAINYQKGIAKIPVSYEIAAKAEPKFSDTFPRIVERYILPDFENNDKFVTCFINLGNNPLVPMIIEIAKTYPNSPVEKTQWFKLNNNNQEYCPKQKRKLNSCYVPIVSYKKGYKTYICPVCNFMTGTLAVENPHILSYFIHKHDCINKQAQVLIKK
jgi:hypothetical protein